MRAREKYGISASSFVFDKAGQVNITLQIFMRGIAEFNAKINTSTAADVSKDTVANLRTDIANLLATMNKSTSKVIEDIRASVILNDVSESMAPLTLEPGTLKELRAATARLAAASRSKRKNSAMSGLGKILTTLKALYGTDGKSGAVKLKRDSIDKTVKDAIAVMRSGPVVDPFIDIIASNSKKKGVNNISQSSIPKGPRGVTPIQGKHVSLGRVLTLLVGNQLASSFNAKSDIETHFIFYTFNSNAGAIRDRCIAEFIIDVERLIERLTDIARLRQGMNITLRELIGMIGNAFIDDQGSINYGMSDVYDSKYNSETGRVENHYRQKFASDEKAANITIEENIKKARNANGKFTKPIVDYHIEALTAENNPNKSIIRVHVLDRVSTPYATQGALLDAGRSTALTELQSLVNNVSETSSDVAKETLKLAQEKSDFLVVTGNGSNSTVQLKGGIEELKRFVASTMPSIIYGSSTSAIKDGKLSSAENAALATVNMLRSSAKGPQQSNGLSVGNIPLQIFPSSLDLTLFGCPLLEFMQQLFIDFGTGTTADAIYTCINITHELTRDSFSTTAKLTPASAYASYYSLLGMINSAIARIDDKSTS